MDDQKTVTAFDASLQQDVPHTVTIDDAGEVVVTSNQTGRFFKLPAGTNAEAFQAALVQHKADNVGQVSAEEVEASKAAALDALGL